MARSSKQDTGIPHRNRQPVATLTPLGRQLPVRRFPIPIQIMGLADLTATVPKLQQICFGNRSGKAFSLRRKSALG
jgi:hypothetical protein